MKPLQLLLLSIALYSLAVNSYRIAGINEEYIFNKEVNYDNVGDERKWWETATIYQIYPRSLKDSNNDGNGDLKGIIEKLSYLKETGIPATWLSPIFKSPQADLGYDISDYKAIDPIFGTMADFDQLMEEANKLGIKIILDFVPNHTSDQHPWFTNSVNREKGYEDFYVWHDGIIDKDGNRKPPNNWLSVPKGSAWTWNEKRKQYYYHQFASAQPDLNFRNPDVINNMTDVLKFWFDKGVAGFRIDAVPHLFEDIQFRDEPRNGDSNSDDYGSLKHIYTKDQNETFDLIYYFRNFTDTYNADHGGDERIIMTEAYTGFSNLIRYYGNANGSELGAHFSFNFDLLTSVNSKSTPRDLIDLIHKWNELPTFIHWNWVLGNHDQHRIATRLGADKVDGYNMILSLLKGIQVTYNGEEFGMENGPVKCEEGQDPRGKANCSTFEKLSRDFERTPFQWDDSINAGFNKGAKPWLPVNPKYKTLNLESQKNLPNTHYSIYKKMQDLRKEFSTIYHMEYNLMYPIGRNGMVLQLAREAMEKDSKVVYSYHTVFNMDDHVQLVDLISHTTGNNTFTVLEASANSEKKIGDTFGPEFLQLLPNEAVLLKYNPPK